MMPGVWDRCATCDKPVVLLGSAWHHEEPAHHPAESKGLVLYVEAGSIDLTEHEEVR